MSMKFTKMEHTVIAKSDSIFYIDMGNGLVKLLNEELTKRNLSNRDAAKAIGISHPTLGIVLSGEQPSFETCQKLSKFLRMPLVSILSLAGLLPNVPESTAEEEQLLYLFRQMTPEQRRDVLEYADFKLNR